MEKGIRLVDVKYNDNGFAESAVASLLADLGALGLPGADNGGDPDGTAWLVWGLTSDEVREAVENGAEAVTVYTADYNAEGWKECIEQFSSGESWAGMMGQAAFVNPDAARLCQACYERMMEDENLDTLAARVRSF